MFVRVCYHFWILILSHLPTPLKNSGTASFLIVERESGKKMPEPNHEITDLELNQMSEKLSQKAKPTGIAGFFAELKVFKNPQFLSLTFAELAASVGFLIPMYYFQSRSFFHSGKLYDECVRISILSHFSFTTVNHFN